VARIVAVTECWRCPCGNSAVVLCEGTRTDVDYPSQSAAMAAGWTLLGVDGAFPEELRNADLYRQVKNHFGQWFRVCPSHQNASGSEIYALVRTRLEAGHP